MNMFAASAYLCFITIATVVVWALDLPRSEATHSKQLASLGLTVYYRPISTGLILFAFAYFFTVLDLSQDKNRIMFLADVMTIITLIKLSKLKIKKDDQ
jgi:hypothetical protein